MFSRKSSMQKDALKDNVFFELMRYIMNSKYSKQEMYKKFPHSMGYRSLKYQQRFIQTNKKCDTKQT